MISNDLLNVGDLLFGRRKYYSDWFLLCKEYFRTFFSVRKIGKSLSLIRN
jgi:hypothetical protein